MNDERNIKQYIILRKDVRTVTGEPVSAHKLAVMTAHASMAFLAMMVRENASQNEDGSYHVEMDMDKETFDGWLKGAFTKVLLSAKNLNDLNKAVKRCRDEGLTEGKDFFLIEDNCYTETLPDEGRETCFIGIGFRPMDTERLKPITKKHQLYQ